MHIIKIQKQGETKLKKKLVHALLLSAMMTSLTISSIVTYEVERNIKNVIASQDDRDKLQNIRIIGTSKELYEFFNIESVINNCIQEVVRAKNILIEQENTKKEFEKKINSIQSPDKKIWYKKYKSFTEEYLSSQYAEQLNLPNTVYDIYSYNEIMIFQKLLAAETEGGDFESKCNVASVIWNRLNSEEYPNTIIEVIYERNGSVQFTPTTDGRIDTVDIVEDDILAIEYTFLFGSTVGDCIAFDNVKGKSWNKNNLEYIFTDSIGHSFYR